MELLNQLGRELYGEKWEIVLAHNIMRMNRSETDTSLTQEQIDLLISGLRKIQAQRNY